MSFEAVERGKFGSPDGALEEGQVSVLRSGAATCLADDLSLVGITDKVVVLADRSNNRVALRAPNDDDRPAQIYPVRQILNKGKPTGRVQVSVLQGIRRLDLEPKALAGRYDMTVTDNLIWWSFGGLSRTDMRIAKGGAGKPAQTNDGFQTRPTRTSKQRPESDELDGDD